MSMISEFEKIMRDIKLFNEKWRDDEYQSLIRKIEIRDDMPTQEEPIMGEYKIGVGFKFMGVWLETYEKKEICKRCGTNVGSNQIRRGE